MLVQATVVPADMVMLCGENAKPLMATLEELAGAGDVAALGVGLGLSAGVDLAGAVVGEFAV